MRRLLIAALLALLGFGLVAGLLPTGAVERLELLTLDARYVLGLGRKAPGDDIVVAWIDQESMDYMDANGVSFPWPREVYAQVLEHLRSAGARAVVFDVLFDQRGNVAEDDRVFGEALAAGTNDALAMKFVEHRETGRDEAETRAFAERGWDAAEVDRAREHGLVLPIEELAAGADQLGFVNIRPDADKTFRRYDLLRLWGPPGETARAYPSLGLAAVMATAPRTTAKMVPDRGVRLGDESSPVIPTDAGGRMLLNFRGKEFTFPHVKFVNILESINRLDRGEAPLYPPERFKDKIVLVGIHAEGYEDAHPTPLSERFAGVELHATALDNLLRADALRAPRWELPLAALAAVLATATVFALPGVVAPVVALLVLLAGSLAAALWAWTGLLAVPMAAPALAGGTSAVGAFLYRLLVEGKQKRELQRAFRSYLAPEVLREVLRDPGAVRLGGEVREVTLFFTDLQGFTGLAEHTRPAELVAFLNDYFTRMCRPVLAERGVIDKFIGDALMAFFGAPIASPDHGRAAIRSALAALEVSAGIAAELAARGLPPIQTRIGIHSGTAVVGNMGSSERFDYTAIGDTVNLASRLEGANKAFGTRCLVSETAWAMTGVGETSEVLGREVGRIGVVGRQAPIRVFEPLALRAGAPAAALELATRWSTAVRALQAGDRAACRAALEGCAELRPGDALSRLWLAKLDDPAFDGVFRLDDK